MESLGTHRSEMMKVVEDRVKCGGLIAHSTIPNLTGKWTMKKEEKKKQTLKLSTLWCTLWNFQMILHWFSMHWLFEIAAEKKWIFLRLFFGLWSITDFYGKYYS